MASRGPIFARNPWEHGLRSARRLLAVGLKWTGPADVGEFIGCMRALADPAADAGAVPLSEEGWRRARPLRGAAYED